MIGCIIHSNLDWRLAMSVDQSILGQEGSDFVKEPRNTSHFSGKILTRYMLSAAPPKATPLSPVQEELTG